MKSVLVEHDSGSLVAVAPVSPSISEPYGAGQEYHVDPPHIVTHPLRVLSVIGIRVYGAQADAVDCLSKSNGKIPARRATIGWLANPRNPGCHQHAA